MTTMSFGPVGVASALSRAMIRQAAFDHGLAIDEEKGVLTSMFTVKGAADAVTAFRAQMSSVQDGIIAHQAAYRRWAFDDAMEEREKRRAFWGRLLRRTPRMRAMTGAEQDAAIATVRSVIKDARATDGDWRTFLDALHEADDSRASSAQGVTSEDVSSTIVAVRLRRIRHQVAIRDVALPRAARRRILALDLPMDTWS